MSSGMWQATQPNLFCGTDSTVNIFGKFMSYHLQGTQGSHGLEGRGQGGCLPLKTLA